MDLQMQSMCQAKDIKCLYKACGGITYGFDLPWRQEVRLKHQSAII